MDQAMRKMALCGFYTGGVVVVLGLCLSWQPATAGTRMELRLKF